LGFDDIQHMDPASREVLHVLARRMGSTPALFVATYRTSGSETPREEATGLVSWSATVSVAPLEPTHVLRLIAGVPADGGEPDETIRAEIVKLADGNPYFA